MTRLHMHSDAARNNASLEQLGIDLQMSAKLLQMAVEIRRLLRHSVAMLRDAEHNEKLAELNLCVVDPSAIPGVQWQFYYTTSNCAELC